MARFLLEAGQGFVDIGHLSTPGASPSSGQLFGIWQAFHLSSA